jgi:Kef-type K+ transport system membrane component KefB
MCHGVAMILGHGRVSAGVTGLALAMSSTAVVIQVLSEEKLEAPQTELRYSLALLCGAAVPFGRLGRVAFDEMAPFQPRLRRR